MATDCAALSLRARQVFEKLKPYFPSNPFGRKQWAKEGIVEDNGVFDLRKSADRDHLIEKCKTLIGYFIEMHARMYRDENASLDGFADECFGASIQYRAELLLLLKDLDFQIETLDFCED